MGKRAHTNQNDVRNAPHKLIIPPPLCQAPVKKYLLNRPFQAKKPVSASKYFSALALPLLLERLWGKW